MNPAHEDDRLDEEMRIYRLDHFLVMLAFQAPTAGPQGHNLTSTSMVIFLKEKKLRGDHCQFSNQEVASSDPPARTRARIYGLKP